MDENLTSDLKENDEKKKYELNADFGTSDFELSLLSIYINLVII